MDFPLIKTTGIKKYSKPSEHYQRVCIQTSGDEFIKENSSVPFVTVPVFKLNQGIKPIIKRTFIPLVKPVNFNNPENNPATKLKNKAFKLTIECQKHIKEAEEKTKELFGDLLGKEGKITARTKSYKSILSKLKSKYEEGTLDINNNAMENCRKAVLDAYGTRVQISPLSNETAKKIVENNEINYYDFISEIQNCINTGKETPKEYMDIIESLKQAQTQAIVNRIIEQSQNPDYKITTIENYGDELASYFTYDQIKSIAYAIDNPDLELVTTMKPDSERINTTITIDEETGETAKKSETLNNNGKNAGKITDDGAVKKSGYASCQMNIEYTFEDKTKGYGELQIRSTLLHEFAEAEHVPYDIRKGKITEKDVKYAPIFKLIKSLNNQSYNQYNKYLTSVYQAIRMQELGLDIKIPELKGEYYDKNGQKIDDILISKLSYEKLIDYNKK